MLDDTVAAVSTPRGKGGVAMLRVSGPDAVRIGCEVFFPKNGKPLSEAPSRTAVYGSICAVDPNGERVPVDDGLATVFRAPASFTGEDTVEICCHGGILLTETVLTALLAAGARPAEAGEFTRRAFLNGKMGLSAAEALADLLEAQSREQLLLAHGGMNGSTEAVCAELYAQMRRVLASVYAVIDYPDEDLADMSREDMETVLLECANGLRRLCGTYRAGHAVAEGIRTVICGKPNVGKSALYNRILGMEAAIVTNVAGTTRDVLTSVASLGRVTLRLSDTAGLHEAGDPVEKIGIGRAREELAHAELIFAVFDASREPDEQDFALCKLLEGSGAAVVAVWNKCDLTENRIPVALQKHFANIVSVSARSGEGMEKLAEAVERLFLDGGLNLRQDAILTNARQYAAAIKALQALDGALEALHQGCPMDICCSGVENAMSQLSELDGRAVSEDLVAEIFSHFCVGK